MPKRKTIEVPGVSHANSPIPLGAQIGKLIFSSPIGGKDRTTKALPADAKQEAAFLFENVRAFMEAAGGTPDDIIKMNVSVANEDVKKALNDEWVRMFPQEDNRPARRTTVGELPRGMNIQAEIVAVLAGNE